VQTGTWNYQLDVVNLCWESTRKTEECLQQSTHEIIITVKN